MQFILAWNNFEYWLLFPAVPNDALTISRGQSNQTFEGLEGQMQSLGRLELASFEMQSFFPARFYSWAPMLTHTDPWQYVRRIEEVRARRIPFRAICLGEEGKEIFNLPVSVESFEYREDPGGDVAFRLSFREYRFAVTPLTATLPAQEAPKDAADTEAPAPVTRVVTASQAAAADSLPGSDEAGPMTMRSGAVVSSGRVVEVPASVKQGGISANHTNYANMNWNYDQRKIYNIWNQQGRPVQGGIAKVSGYYLVALTMIFGTTGDAVKIVLENGAVIPCIIGDSKSEDPSKHGESGNKYGHLLDYGKRGYLIDIVEWEKYGGSINNFIVQTGWVNQKVVRVINYGSWLNG